MSFGTSGGHGGDGNAWVITSGGYVYSQPYLPPWLSAVPDQSGQPANLALFTDMPGFSFDTGTPLSGWLSSLQWNTEFTITAMYFPPSNGVGGMYAPLWSCPWNAVGVANFSYLLNSWSQQDFGSTDGYGADSWFFPQWADISH